MVVDGHPLHEAGGHVGQRPVLVCLRAGAVAQMYMSRAGIHRTTGGARDRRAFSLSPGFRLPAYRDSLSGMARWASSGLPSDNAAAPDPRWLRCLGFAHSGGSLSPKRPTSSGGRAWMGSPSRDVAYWSYRTRLIFFAAFFWAL